MFKHLIAICGALVFAAPCSAAELFDAAAPAPSRSGALAGAYVRLPLGKQPDASRVPRAGLRLAFARTIADPRTFAVRREADLIDLRLASAQPPRLYVAGQPASGLPADRVNAGGTSGGRLDKIMIGAGIALGAVAAYFLVSSVAD